MPRRRAPRSPAARWPASPPPPPRFGAGSARRPGECGSRGPLALTGAAGLSRQGLCPPGSGGKCRECRGRSAVVSRSFWEVGAGAGAGTALPFPWNFLPGTCGSGLPPPAPPPAAFSPFSFLFFLPPRAAGGGAGAGARPRLGFPAAARGRAPCRAHRGLRTIWRSLCSKPTRACAQTLPFYPRKIIVSSFKINTRLAISTFFPNIIRRGARGRTGPAPRGPEHSCRGPARPGPGAATRGVCAWGRPPPAEPGVARAAQRLRLRGRPGGLPWAAGLERRPGRRARRAGRPRPSAPDSLLPWRRLFPTSSAAARPERPLATRTWDSV